MAGKKKKLQHVHSEKQATNLSGLGDRAGVTSGRNGSVHGCTEVFSCSVGYVLLVLSIAGVVGYVHFTHITYMFESDKHFSHLSTLEREMSFRTEMGLYFSYFKTMIEAPTFHAGIGMLVFDNVTEFPLVINTLKRFNLYPEVTLGAAYRIFDNVMGMLAIPTQQCWQVNRGHDLPPVSSCEGMGDSSYFYTNNIFFLNGVLMALLFLYGTYLSRSIFGGLVSVVAMFYNHSEATRVQWTPPLRESFAYPFFVLQMLVVSWTLRCRQPGTKHIVLIAILTMCFMLPWQFAQFALMTQTLAVFGVYMLRMIPPHKVKTVLRGQLMGFLISFLLLFGNEMLLTSFFLPVLLSVATVIMLEPVFESASNRLVIWIAQVIVLLAGTLSLKTLANRFVICEVLFNRNILKRQLNSKNILNYIK